MISSTSQNCTYFSQNSLSINFSSAMLLIECALILEQYKIPIWLLSRNTSYDVVSLLHRLYPAFMNGCRCIVGAFVVDHKSRRIEALVELSESVQVVTMKARSVKQITEGIAQALIEEGSSSDRDGVAAGKKGADSVTMADALRNVQRNTLFNTIVSGIQQKAVTIQDPVLLHKLDKSQNDYSWLRNIVVYLVARFIIVKSHRKGGL
jgi:hypothetical protein